MEYKLISNLRENLNVVVTDYLNDGWVLYGTPSVGSNHYYFQAVVRGAPSVATDQVLTDLNNATLKVNVLEKTAELQSLVIDTLKHQNLTLLERLHRLEKDQEEPIQEALEYD